VTSRLYTTTRPLAERVDRMLRPLGISRIGSSTTAVLIALYVVGL
jgi:hypothetical protein